MKLPAMVSKFDEQIRLSEEPLLGRKTSPSEQRGEGYGTARTPRRHSLLYVVCSLFVFTLISLSTIVVVLALRVLWGANNDCSELLPCKSTIKVVR